MAVRALMPDDDGDLNEKMKILLAKKAALEQERDMLGEKRKAGSGCRDFLNTNGALPAEAFLFWKCF
jgi:hypothetical protein